VLQRRQALHQGLHRHHHDAALQRGQAMQRRQALADDVRMRAEAVVGQGFPVGERHHRQRDRIGRRKSTRVIARNPPHRKGLNPMSYLKISALILGLLVLAGCKESASETASDVRAARTTAAEEADAKRLQAAAVENTNRAEIAAAAGVQARADAVAQKDMNAAKADADEVMSDTEDRASLKTAQAEFELANTQAEGRFDVAKQQCDAEQGVGKDNCMARANNALIADKAAAAAVLSAADTD
jgi:hypothetical protein